MQSTRTIEVLGKRVEYTLRKRKKQTKYSLAVYRGGRILLTVPYSISFATAERYMIEKREWIKKIFEKHPTLFVQKTQHAQKREYVQYKEMARKFVHRRLSELNGEYGFTYKRVSIRHNVSRWGSCSELGNVNFDYRILFLPERLQDYLLVHELCHLKEMNHSKAFWNLVAKTIPNHKVLRKELKKIAV
jgi:predicted metal-dependent hydrolase